MKNQLFQAQDILLCTCPNQYLLAPGCTCELCNGLVADLELPELAGDCGKEQFDLGYFEALERLYEDIEFAA